MDQYHQDIIRWRKALDANLRKKDSWLALAGLYWLNDGENSFGAGQSNTIILPPGSAPDRIGSFIVEENQVSLVVVDGIEVAVDGLIKKEAVLEPDSTGSPTRITLGDLTLLLIEREDGLGIRLWDNQRPEREDFPGRSWFPIDQSYLIQGKYQPFDEHLDLIMSRKNGSDYQSAVEGQVHFEFAGKELSLLVFEQDDGSLFTLFLDETSGDGCYPAGRYLVLDPPQEGLVKIDFNRAYNPPCAFTDFATCPLPPAQNRLAVAILAGERYGL